MLACMAGPLDTGQQIMTFFFVQFLPIIVFILYHLTYTLPNFFVNDNLQDGSLVPPGEILCYST